MKGKTKPVEIFTLIGAKNDSAERGVYPSDLRRTNPAFRNSVSATFAQARLLFSEFLEFRPEDALARMYLDRALEYEEQPPDESWNAVEVFKKK